MTDAAPPGAHPPAPGSYPPPGAYPPGGSYPPPGAYPPGGAYPPSGAYPPPGTYPPPGYPVAYQGLPAQPGPKRGIGKPAIIGIVVAVVLLLGFVGWRVISSARDRTLAEAVQGTWNCTWGPTDPFVLEVSEGTYLIRAEDSEVLTGTWSIEDGVLTIEGLWDAVPLRIEVPETVPDRRTLTIVALDERLPITLTVTEDGDHFKVQTGDEYDYLECDR